MEVHPHGYSGLCGISFSSFQYLSITSVTLFDMSAVTVVLMFSLFSQTVLQSQLLLLLQCPVSFTDD